MRRAGARPADRGNSGYFCWPRVPSANCYFRLIHLYISTTNTWQCARLNIRRLKYDFDLHGTTDKILKLIMMRRGSTVALDRQDILSE